MMSHTAQCSMHRGAEGLCRSFPQAFHRPFQRADKHQHTAPVLTPPCQAPSSTMRVCVNLTGLYIANHQMLITRHGRASWLTMAYCTDAQRSLCRGRCCRLSGISIRQQDCSGASAQQPIQTTGSERTAM